MAGEAFPEPAPKALAPPTVALIQRETARAFGVPLNALLSPRRTGDVVEARQVGMWLARTLTRHSYPSIGRLFHRDHSDVWHAVRRIERRLEIDGDLGDRVYALRRRITTLAGSLSTDAPTAAKQLALLDAIAAVHRRRLVRLAGAALAASTLAGCFGDTPAPAKPCAPRPAAMHHLQLEFGEVPIGLGFAEGGEVELTLSPSGDFSLVVTAPDGETCLMASGSGWRWRQLARGQRT